MLLLVRSRVLLQQSLHGLLHLALCRLFHLHQVRVQAPVQEHRVVQYRAMVHQVRPAQPAVLAQRLPGLVQNQVRELVVPDGRVGHVPAVRIHIGSFLHCGGEWMAEYVYNIVILAKKEPKPKDVEEKDAKK